MTFQRALLTVFAGAVMAACSESPPPSDTNKAPVTKEEHVQANAPATALFRQALDRGTLAKAGYQLVKRSIADCNSGRSEDIRYLVKKTVVQDTTKYDLYSVCVSRHGSRPAKIKEVVAIKKSDATVAAEAAARVAAEQKRQATADSIRKANNAAQDAMVTKEFMERDAEYALLQKKDSTLLQRAGFEIIGRIGIGDCNDNGDLTTTRTNQADPAMVYTLHKISADKNLTYTACVFHSESRGPVVWGKTKPIENMVVLQNPTKTATP